MRLTGFGKLLLGGAMGLALGIGVATSTSAVGQGAASHTGAVVAPKVFGEESVILAAILAFIQGVMMQAFQSMLLDEIMGTGMEKTAQATVEQIAANTIGIQTALKQQLDGQVDATVRQTQKQEENILRRTFGTFGTRTIQTPRGSRTVSVGATPPSGCRRSGDAVLLDTARQRGVRVQQQGSTYLVERNRNVTSASSGMTRLRSDIERHGDRALSLDWIQKDNLNASEVDFATRSIAYLTNPMPPPIPPGCTLEGDSLNCGTQHGTTLASKEYRAKFDAHRAAVKLPQDILLRQVALRAGHEESGADAYLQTIRDWAEKAIEDPLNPQVLQHKTEKGVLAELALSMNHLLWLETERMKSDQERNAMLALLASSALEGRAESLRRDYRNAIRAD